MRWWVPWHAALVLAAAQALWLPLLLGVSIFLPSLPSPSLVRSTLPGRSRRPTTRSRAFIWSNAQAQEGRGLANLSNVRGGGASSATSPSERGAQRQSELRLVMNLTRGEVDGVSPALKWLNRLSFMDRFYHHHVPSTPHSSNFFISLHSSHSTTIPTVEDSPALSFQYPSDHLLIKTLPPYPTEVRELFPKDLAATGVAYQRWDRRRFKQGGGRYWRGNRAKNGSDTKNINKIWVWGERNSCTTLVTEILKANFKLKCGSKQTECVIGGLPWKHGFMRHAGQ